MDSGSLRKDNRQAGRARWCRPTLTTTFSSTNATLFNSWLLSTSPATFVEYLNDIALDCREANVKVSASLHSSNQQTHRLKHAVSSHGIKGGHPLLQSISDSPFNDCIAKASRLCHCLQTIQDLIRRAKAETQDLNSAEQQQ
jgi:hypothetical protein